MAEKTKINNTEELNDKQKALDAALKNIERSFGKGAVMRLGDDAAKLNVEVISTSSIGLDMALALGVDIDNLLVAQPDTGEQAMEIVEALVRSNAIDVIVIDSVAALVPRAEIDGEMGDSHMGLQARLMSQALRKLTGVIKKSNTTTIFINQLREKIGVMFGNPETTTGGKALKFYASVRIDVRRIESLKKGTEIIGNRTRAKIVKNKIAPPFKQAEFDIMYGKGISKEGDLLDVGVDFGIVDKSGSWFSYKEQRLGQGRDNSKEFLMANPDVAAAIEKEIREKNAASQIVAEPEEIEEDLLNDEDIL